MFFLHFARQPMRIHPSDYKKQRHMECPKPIDHAIRQHCMMAEIDTYDGKSFCDIYIFQPSSTNSNHFPPR